MREAQASFGDSRVFLEKYLEDARHVEVQILFDHYGKGLYLFDRDCSIQRRHQKVIEEAPAPGLSESTRQQMAKTALQAGAAIHYRSTGTIEFLVDENEDFYFMEMNTRLQVEHPVTEMITGLDLVEWQLRIASGEKLTLTDKTIRSHGHAVEARLYAENPQNNFMPSAGPLRYFQLPPETSAVRVDSGFRTGDVVSVYYDPLLAKLIAWGENRMQAIQTMQSMLNRTAVLGIHTNLTLLNRIISNPQFMDGNLSTQFIARQQTQLLQSVEEVPQNVIVLACLMLLKLQQEQARQFQSQHADGLSPWFLQNGWRLNQPVQLTLNLWRRETHWQVIVVFDNKTVQLQWPSNNITLSGNQLALLETEASRFEKGPSFTIVVDEEFLTVFCDGEQWQFSTLNPAVDASGFKSRGGLQAPMPGTVVSIDVQPGQTVSAGDRLLIMEAMKMEHSLLAPHAGKIETIFYQPGDRVNEGAELIAFSNSR